MQTIAAMSDDLDLPALRKKLNLTQADLAKAAGVDVSTVWRWENDGVPSRGPARAFLDRLVEDARKAEAA
jgi:transcriptional regulator with XRE-family HTH domain